ncbi:hypothetical protein EI94DRAFT_1699678 [Lactarius quietus]|nr:hypothetical protein EI94DRAFT_1699678 [Lactarius quietus]
MLYGNGMCARASLCLCLLVLLDNLVSEMIGGCGGNASKSGMRQWEAGEDGEECTTAPPLLERAAGQAVKWRGGHKVHVECLRVDLRVAHTQSYSGRASRVGLVGPVPRYVCKGHQTALKNCKHGLGRRHEAGGTGLRWKDKDGFEGGFEEL